MIEDITYGRITSSVHNKRRKRRDEQVVVGIAYWLPSWIPSYAVGKYLVYYVDVFEYRIYNPLGFRFDINLLHSQIKTHHMTFEGLEAIDFSVKEST